MHFSKNSFADYEKVNFQNMMDISILVVYPEKLQDYNLAFQNKNNMHEIFKK